VGALAKRKSQKGGETPIKEQEKIAASQEVSKGPRD